MRRRGRCGAAGAAAGALAAAFALATGAAAAHAEAGDAGLQALALAHRGLERRLLVHLPSGLDAARPAPLVLALHGGGGHAGLMADDERYGLRASADRHGFIVVFPNGYSRLPGGRLATWNAGGCCGAARDRGSDDVGFLRAAVARRWPVDRTRVFAAGMSNGGMMAYRLACEAADLFRAVASVAGTEAVAECAPSRPVSVLHIHALDDDHVRFDGGAGPGAFRDRGAVMDFTSVPETISRWVRRDRCEAAPRSVLQVEGARCEVHAGCAGEARVQLCVTERGGHAWPGAARVRRGKAPASDALDAGEVIWTFFRDSAPR